MAKDLNNGDRLLSSILDSARAEAEAVLAEAKAQAGAHLAEAGREVSRIEAEAEAKAQAAYSDVLERSRTNADLDSRKRALSERRGVVDEAFAQALVALNAMAGAERASLLEKLLVDNAEGGETVLPAHVDEAILGELLPGVNAKLASCGKQALALGGAWEGVAGGFLLTGASYELNCSFEAILRDLRESEVSGVANILFG